MAHALANQRSTGNPVLLSARQSRKALNRRDSYLFQRRTSSTFPPNLVQDTIRHDSWQDELILKMAPVLSIKSAITLK